LKNEDIDEPKYQCKLKFLSYCEEAPLPVLLIVVDIKNHIAYWLNINRKVLKSLRSEMKPDAKSISLKIPKENKIEKSHNEYLSKWEEILEEHKKYKKLSESTSLEQIMSISNEISKIKSEHPDLDVKYKIDTATKEKTISIT